MNNLQQLSDLYPLMVDDLPGIDTLTWTREAQEAQRDFCLASKAFRETLASISLVADQADYTLTPSWDCRINSIAEVWLKTESDVTNGLKGTQQEEDDYDFAKPDTLTLADGITPSVAVTSGLVVRVILVPEHLQSGNNVLSIDFLNDYADGIIARTAWRLKKMPKQRWTDLKMVPFHLAQYNTAITDAMADISMKGKQQPDGFSAAPIYNSAFED